MEEDHQAEQHQSDRSLVDRAITTFGANPDEWTLGDRRLAIIAIVVGLAIVITAVCGYVFGWEWTGLAKPKQRTFWDWLELLIVPVVLALGGYLFTRAENRRAQRLANQREQTDRQIEEQRAQETALQAYLEQITELVREGLRDEKPLSPLRLLTRGRTLSLFWQLDLNRKRALLQILHEAGLIKNEENPIVGLSGADLRGAYLRELNLNEAKLDGADLKGAALTGADLSNAILRNARVTNVQLGASRSLAGATMREGQKYEEWLGTSDGQDWLKRYKKDLGERKRAHKDYEKWIQTTEGQMWLKAMAEENKAILRQVYEAAF